MADYVANIAMNTCSSVQVSALSDHRIITKIAAYLENDVNHWQDTSMEEQNDLSGLSMTVKGRALTR